MAENKVQIVIEAKDVASAAFRSLEKSIEDMTREGKGSVDRLSNAFKTLNLKSAFDIDKEKVRIKAAFEQIRLSGVASADEIKRAHQAAAAQISALDKEAKAAGTSFLSLKSASGALTGALAGVGVASLGKDCIDAALKVQKLETAFRSVSGKDAARELAWLREESNRLGLDITATADEYAKLAAAAKGTALEGEETRRIFTAISESATALGLSGEEAAGALMAVQQMISKGKVSAEELRQQLGERLPGAFQIAAKAMGVSTAELDKMLVNGRVTAEDMLPKLATALHDTYGNAAVEAAQKGQGAINIFNNEMLDSKAKVGEALMPAFTDILKGMKPISEAIVFILKGFAYLGPLVGMTIDKMSALARAPVDGLDATKKKMEEIENNFFATISDIDKRYGDHAESTKKTDKELAEEKAKSDKLRQESAKKTELEMSKSNEQYAKAVGDTDRLLVEKYEKAYQERKKTVEQFHDEQLKAAGDNAAAEQDIKIARFAALLELDKQHKGDAELIEMDKQARLLATAKKAGEDRIALIDLQIAQGARSEAEGSAEILDIRNKQVKAEAELAEKRFKQISSTYDADSEEYKKAEEAKLQAAKTFTQSQIELARAAAQAKQEELEKSSLDYKLELDKRLDWLEDSERDGLITHQQAARDKLEAEKNYLGQLAELRRRELADTAPGTVEHKKALAAKYQADREYFEAKKALDDQINADIIAGYDKEAAAAEAASQREQASFQSFAQWFYAQWDAITERVTSLGPKMAAAFGTPLKAAENTVEGLRDKLQEVAEASRKAAEASRDYFQFSRILGDHAKAAENLRYEYYSQKLALLELTEQLKKMDLATQGQISRANNLVESFRLIDDADLSDVRGEIERLTDALKEAEEQARDTVDSLRDELDEMLGNREAIEKRDYDQKREDLEKKLKEARAAGADKVAAEYADALNLLNEIHKRKLETIREEAYAKKKAQEEEHEQELKRIEEEKKARDAALRSNSATNAPTLAMATGGRIPGPDSRYDNIWVKARTGEWFIRNEAAHFWGDAFMAGINNPMSDIGRRIQDHMNGIIHTATAPIFAPKLTFATGGPVITSNERPAAGHTIIINTTEPVDSRLVRRKIIPEIERMERRKR
ncbi:MAG: tape measure protein [Geobacteraceae bacterium]|nr:tape measure protein [Geobacteraceae bacterium]